MDYGYGGIFDFFNYGVYYDWFDHGRLITIIAIAAEIFFIIIFFKDRKIHRDLTNNMADTKLLKRKKIFRVILTAAISAVFICLLIILYQYIFNKVHSYKCIQVIGMALIVCSVFAGIGVIDTIIIFICNKKIKKSQLSNTSAAKATAASARNFCWNCGAAVPEGNSFCEQCGKKI